MKPFRVRSCQNTSYFITKAVSIHSLILLFPISRASTTVFAPLLIVLGLLYPVAAMIGYIASEKEHRQKELMKMMSVTESDINWAWFMTFFIFNMITATLISIVATSLYVSSDGFLMWIFWVFTFTAITVFTMVIASLTSSSTRAVLIGLLVFFIGYFVTSAADRETLDSGILSMISLPVTAFSYGLQEIGRLEDLGVGITSNSINSTDSPSGYTFQNALNALFFDTIFWGIMTWYLNRVIAPDYGQALPFWFPCSPSYWFPGRAVADHEGDEKASENSAEVPVEPVGETLERQSERGENIVIRGLTKVFGEHRAVDGLNLTMYSGQITALLGHNGTSAQGARSHGRVCV
jgi:ATP-binding cassette subfamily A (ABC1) protein 3